MNLFLVPPMSCIPLMLTGEQSTWDRLGVTKETVLYEPGEEAEVLRGTCIMMGSSARFIEIDARQFDKEFGERCYVLSVNQPIVKRISPNTQIVKLAYRSLFERTHGIN